MFTVWHTLMKQSHIGTFPSPHTPIHHKSAFTPALALGPFDKWREREGLIMSDMINGTKVLAFETCKRKFYLDEAEKYHYTQL